MFRFFLIFSEKKCAAAAFPSAGSGGKAKKNGFTCVKPFEIMLGGDLLSHYFDSSIIGAGRLNCRVRNGIGCFPSANATEQTRV
jgi:hypothetical protein